MNRATFNELQRQRCYPSITMLINTTPGSPLTTSELDTATRLVCHTDDRLDGDISDTLRHNLITRLTDLITEQAGQRSTRALAVFVSPEHTAAVRLGWAVHERVTIDDTFTTRDLVADLDGTTAPTSTPPPHPEVAEPVQARADMGADRWPQIEAK